MGIGSWLKNLRKPEDVLERRAAATNAEKQRDSAIADIGGTLFIRGSAAAEAKRLAGEDEPKRRARAD